MLLSLGEKQQLFLGKSLKKPQRKLKHLRIYLKSFASASEIMTFWCFNSNRHLHCRLQYNMEIHDFASSP